jgi:DNA-binding NtrC family response regulator
VSGRVLVVDDEQEMCEAIAAGLGPRGYEVRWETSAEAALATLEAAEVDVVLTDLNMRGMDGLALCERIVASRPDVPVVVITAFGSLETAIAAIRAGAYDFITKPVKMDALSVALSRAVTRRSRSTSTSLPRRTATSSPRSRRAASARTSSSEST